METEASSDGLLIVIKKLLQICFVQVIKLVLWWKPSSRDITVFKLYFAWLCFLAVDLYQCAVCCGCVMYVILVVFIDINVSNNNCTRFYLKFNSKLVHSYAYYHSFFYNHYFFTLICLEWYSCKRITSDRGYVFKLCSTLWVL